MVCRAGKGRAPCWADGLLKRADAGSDLAGMLLLLRLVVWCWQCHKYLQLNFLMMGQGQLLWRALASQG